MAKTFAVHFRFSASYTACVNNRNFPYGFCHKYNCTHQKKSGSTNNCVIYKLIRSCRNQYLSNSCRKTSDNACKNDKKNYFIFCSEISSPIQSISIVPVEEVQMNVIRKKGFSSAIRPWLLKRAYMPTDCKIAKGRVIYLVY